MNESGEHNTPQHDEQAQGNTSDGDKLPVCGIIMPISECDGCPAGHWEDVRLILSEAIRTAKLEPRMVSEAAEVSVIHKRIIQRLYEDPVVVCDVSGMNSNVMFELGVRLTFNQPTVIVKDIDTQFSFDTGIIEHLLYRRDLRYTDAVRFKERLGQKLIATLEIKRKDPNYSPFLKNFEFRVPKLDSEEVTTEQLLADRMTDLERAVRTATLELRQELTQFSRGSSASGFVSPRVAIVDRLLRRGLAEVGVSDVDYLSVGQRVALARQMLGGIPESARSGYVLAVADAVRLPTSVVLEEVYLEMQAGKQEALHLLSLDE